MRKANASMRSSFDVGVGMTGPITCRSTASRCSGKDRRKKGQKAKPANAAAIALDNG